ncbi:hypothetical protein MY5147_000597 [Beauveria neobassiana]
MYCMRSPLARRQFLKLATRPPPPPPHRSVAASPRWKSDKHSPEVEATAAAASALIYPAPATTQHDNLASFISYAERTGLDATSTVYVGTHYEYTVAASLARYGLALRRVGGARDRGTDLLGTWTLPDAAGGSSAALRVLVQCKAGAGQRVGPQHIRELEGARAGAPPGWRGDDVLAVLACERAATKGVREALGHSRWPMAYVFCEGGGGGGGGGGGAVRQMLWNKKAEESGLAGLGVGTRHVGEGEKEDTELVLTRKGRALPFVGG